MMDDAPELMRGMVELDEGGKLRKANKPEPPAPIPLFEKPEPSPPPQKADKRRRKAGRGTDKSMAFSIVERGGKARVEPVLSQAHPSGVLASDELPADSAIGRMHAGHITVNHSADELARDDARTGLRAQVNTAESVHSIFQRAIIGVWHQISGKHMGRYLREVAFRWNHRGDFERRLVASASIA